jgi:predicted amidohydrolase
MSGGSVIGVYRKLHPAIRRSVYAAGEDVPVFRAGGLTFGIVICNDSNYPEPALLIAAQGATVLFVPTNTALPLAKAGAGLVDRARNVDATAAVENGLWVVRADVAGECGGLISYGSTGIVNAGGAVVTTPRSMSANIIVAEIG